MKRLLVGLLVLGSSLSAMELSVVKPEGYNSPINGHKYLQPNFEKVQILPSLVRAPEKLGAIELHHGDKGFCVVHNNQEHQVAPYFSDPILRNISKEQLAAFLSAGYLAVNQMDNGEFSLKAKGKLKGGGPLFGAFMYWVTKSVCYGTVAAGVGTIAVGTGGAAVVVGSHVAAAGAGMAVSATIAAPATIVTTAGIGTATAATSVAVAGTGAGLAAAAINGAAAAGVTVAGMSATSAAAATTVLGVATVSTTGTAATVGTAAACVMAVESLSTAVGTFFGMLPTP